MGTDMDTGRRLREDEGGGEGHASTNQGTLKASRAPEARGEMCRRSPS